MSKSLIKISAFVLALFASPAVFADAASDFVKLNVQQGTIALEAPTEAERIAGICTLLSSSLEREYIGNQWLGTYATLPREAQAVQNFIQLVPSILISTIKEAVGEFRPVKGSAQVAADSVLLKDGNLQVNVTFTTESGSEYEAGVVLRETAGSFKVLDILYMDLSVVGYLAENYKYTLDDSYNADVDNSMPVTDLIKSIEAGSNFIRCP